MRIFIQITFLILLTANCLAADFTEPQSPYGEPKIIGAKAADPEAWPATFIFSSSTGSCTATAVAAEVLLTAAHCVEESSNSTVSFHEKILNAKCEQHPSYALGNSTLDFALCHLDAKLSSIYFESIGTSMAYPRIGQAVTLLGFGCTQDGGFNKDFGVLHIGDSKVVGLPTGDKADIVTEGGAAVCFGDSGGAAYFFTNINDLKRRVIIALNSRGNISNKSYLSSTSNRSFLDWVVLWEQKEGLMICGIEAGATGCRPS